MAPFELHLEAAPSASPSQQTDDLVRYVERELDRLAAMHVVGPIVFDIDDTLVASDHTKYGTLILPVVRLFQKYARSHPVYICTARPDDIDSEEATRRMLARHGIGGWCRLYFLETRVWKHGSSDDVAAYKWKVRERVQAMHPNSPILLRVGDMWWDAAPPSTKGELEAIGLTRNPHRGAVWRVGTEWGAGMEMGLLLPVSKKER